MQDAQPLKQADTIRKPIRSRDWQTWFAAAEAEVNKWIECRKVELKLFQLHLHRVQHQDAGTVEGTAQMEGQLAERAELEMEAMAKFLNQQQSLWQDWNESRLKAWQGWAAAKKVNWQSFLNRLYVQMDAGYPQDTSQRSTHATGASSSMFY